MDANEMTFSIEEMNMACKIAQCINRETDYEFDSITFYADDNAVLVRVSKKP